MKPSTENRFVFLLVLLVGFLFSWLAATLPAHIDEALTHQHFTSQGWRIAISTYPFPNNHVLFSVLGAFAVMLPLEPLFAMRMVSVFAALASLVLMYKLIRLKATPIVAFLGTLFWVSTLTATYFGVHARGYGLQIMLLLAGLYLVELWDKQNDLKEPLRLISKSGIGLTLTSALGFFTIPTFLFPFSSLLLLLMFYAWKKGIWKQQLVQATLIGAATAGLTIVLYSPLFYYTGVDALIDNQWVRERSFANVGMEGLCSLLFDISAYGGHVALILLLIMTAWSTVVRNWKGVLFVAAFFLVPIFGMVVMGSVPFPRTFAYLIAVAVVAVFANLHQLSAKGLTNLAYGIAAIVIVASGWFTYRGIAGAWHKDSANAEAIQTELQACCDGQLVYVHGWNECAHLIDYYTWRKGSGPTVKVLYQDDFWEEFRQNEGKLYFKTAKQPEPERCNRLLEKGNVAVYECN